MKNYREFLVGLFVCTILTSLYWGVHFLKGENIFSNKTFFYAIYDNVDGLTISRPVTVNGFRVGQVSNISFLSNHKANLIVQISIEEDISFSKNSMLEIYDSDIMGSKALELQFMPGNDIALNGDTLIGTISTGLTGEVTEQFGSVKVGLDALIVSFDKVLKEVNNLSNSANRILVSNEQKLSNSIESIEVLSDVLSSQAVNINKSISNLASFSDSLSTVDISSISKQILILSFELETLLAKMNGVQGSIPRFFNEDSIYNSFSSTIKNLDALIIDIKENPKKYVSISIWGNHKNNDR